jgi:phospholipase/carboxylesterase
MTKKYKNLMVMLHGYGSNGDDLKSLAPFFETILPDTYFYSPDGIEPCELGVYGFQWFSLFDRSDEAIAKELAAKAGVVREMIAKKAKDLEIENKNIILLGFSQGTMLGIYLSLSTELPYKAVVAYSGRLFVPREIKNTKTPICLIHGKMDEIVPFESLIDAKERLGKFGVKTNTLGIENLSHSIDMEGIKFAVDFLKGL